MSDPYQVRIRVERPCPSCNGTGRMPDPNREYRRLYASTVTCRVCGGGGWAASKALTLSELYDLLHGNLPRDPASQSSDPPGSGR